MFHVHTKNTWNGQKAADMYKGPLAKALKKTWGQRRSCCVVEDGDRKGNQSGNGIRAKAEAKIRALTLPPHTPSWMPLDYAVWSEILRRMDMSGPRAGTESKAAYVKRLEETARKLPRGYVKSVIAKMKGNIKDVVDADGYHAQRCG